MYTLWFSLIWTLLVGLGVLFLWREPDFAQESMFVRILLSLMPLAGLFFIRHSLRKLRRFRSVRCEDSEGRRVYIWTELDGSELRSVEDPRPAWDEEDRNFAD